MKPEEIKVPDLLRMFAGEVPASFYIELVIRVLFVYLLLMVAMRLLGRRMAGQMNKNEMAALVSLAAAIGIPIQAPDRGLIPAVIIAVLVVIIGRVVSYYASRNQKFEEIAQANLSILVQNGMMCLDEMKRVGITRERVLSQVRYDGLTHLGKVKRLYMEAGGGFSLVQEPNPKPGLSVLPEMDTDFQKELVQVKDIQVCHNCGYEREHITNPKPQCIQCNDTHWVYAVTEMADNQKEKKPQLINR
jgi:uncharacterized membrane protein YcaP (DUF421 family)